MRTSRNARRAARSINVASLSNNLLRYRSYCRIHFIVYPTNVRRDDGVVVSTWCPECLKDDEWFNKAVAELRAEGQAEIWKSQALARAEQLAGHELRKYRHG